MHRLFIALAILIPACAPSASSTAPTAVASRGHLSASEEEHHVTHPQSDVTCRDEVPTGTNLERRKCRSQAEKDTDRKVVEDLYLDPSSRPLSTCEPSPCPSPFQHQQGNGHR